MNTLLTEAVINDLAGFPGMDGCALVETDTGMTWFHAGNTADIDRVAEAAIEFWRIQMRLSEHFTAMGPLQSAAYSFSQRVVALFPCSEQPPLVLVCIAHKTNVSWAEWGQRVAKLKHVLRQSRASPVAAT